MWAPDEEQSSTTWYGQSLEGRSRRASDQDVGISSSLLGVAMAASRVTGLLRAGPASPYFTLNSFNPLEVTFPILQMRKPRAREVMCP